MGQKKPKVLTPDPYRHFDKIDGTHPWSKNVSHSHVPYKVRELASGSVTYFNYDLAKEMGLIQKDHPHRLNNKLKQKIMSTFCLRIINEYDLESKSINDFDLVKKNTYMASRYLQLQHKDKRGLNSGDGRGIWNGVIKNKGITWDVSSRGTGVTCLSPGSVLAGKNLQTGSEEYGYGCGLAEVDELIGTSIMSETLHNYGFTTERMLAIIDFGDGCGIGVRAGKNLIRPAHLFLHLKQNKFDQLKQATDYLIDRQVTNKEWIISSSGKKKYDEMLDLVCDSFARFSAQLEREYLFTWLDWDGDNVLANAGLIDYGSIRWLGLRHDKYRYDDVERYSTTLNEQKNKAKFTVQVFAQMVHFLKTNKKEPIQSFKDHAILSQFDKSFDDYRLKHFLFQMGLNEKQSKLAFTHWRDQCHHLFHQFTFFEKLKTSSGEQEVEDGINHPPILNMRSFLRLIPKLLIESDLNIDTPRIDSLLFELASEFSNEKDMITLEKHHSKFLNLISSYIKLLSSLSSKSKLKVKDLKCLFERSSSINREDRVTGNALVFIVQQLIEKNKTTSILSLQKLIESVIQKQVFLPGQKENKKTGLNSKEKFLLKSFDNLIHLYKEDL